MAVQISKSVCVDCISKDTCQKLNKIHGMCNPIRKNDRHPDDIFDVIITSCSIKNYDRFCVGDEKNDGTLYFCAICGSMHRNNSRIGMWHKKKAEVKGKEEEILITSN